MADEPQPGAASGAVRVQVSGAGTFAPPSPAVALRERHKAISADIRRLTAERDGVEAELVALGARESLALKLSQLSPAETQLLEAVLAEKVQRVLAGRHPGADDAHPAEAAAPPVG